MLTEALHYAQAGIPVLALAAGSKKPRRGSRGVHDATTDAHTLRQWWSCDRHNLGLACGHRMDVLDIDPRNGGKPPTTAITVHAIVQTPGGWHFYLPVGAFFDATHHGQGWDYLSRGSYVAAPPTFGYSWLIEWRDDPITVEVEVES